MRMPAAMVSTTRDVADVRRERLRASRICCGLTARTTSRAPATAPADALA